MCGVTVLGNTWGVTMSCSGLYWCLHQHTIHIETHKLCINRDSPKETGDKYQARNKCLYQKCCPDWSSSEAAWIFRYQCSSFCKADRWAGQCFTVKTSLDRPSINLKELNKSLCYLRTMICSHKNSTELCCPEMLKMLYNKPCLKTQKNILDKSLNNF